MKTTQTEWAERIEIWERWLTIDGVVYMEWKQPHEKEWHRKRTANKAEPVVLRKFYTPKEWNLKEMKLLTESTHPKLTNKETL